MLNDDSPFCHILLIQALPTFYYICGVFNKKHQINYTALFLLNCIDWFQTKYDNFNFYLNLWFPPNLHSCFPSIAALSSFFLIVGNISSLFRWVHNPPLEEKHPCLEVAQEEEERMVCVELGNSWPSALSGLYYSRTSSCRCSFLLNFNHCLLDHLGIVQTFCEKNFDNITSST